MWPDWAIFESSWLQFFYQIFCIFLGYCERNYFLSKNCCGSFLNIVWKLWATFYSNIWSHCVRTVTQFPSIKRENIFWYNRFAKKKFPKYNLVKNGDKSIWQNCRKLRQDDLSLEKWRVLGPIWRKINSRKNKLCFSLKAFFHPNRSRGCWLYLTREHWHLGELSLFSSPLV